MCKEVGPKYAKLMMDIYSKVVNHDKPNVMGAHIPLPLNLHFQEWHFIVHSDLERETLQFLQYGFPVGFVGAIPTPPWVITPQPCATLKMWLLTMAKR